MMSSVVEPKWKQDLNGCFAIAVAELRTLRRLVRTWVFVALAAGLMGSVFVFHSFLHGIGGGVSRYSVLPRFMWSDINNYVLWVLMAAVVFLTFDSWHRDEQSRIQEALDSRPISNLTLFAGRLCGVATATWAALFCVAILIQAAGTVGPAFGWVVYPIEPVAMFTFLFVDAIPALVAWAAVVLLLVGLVGNRLVVALAAMAFLALHMWAQANAPAFLLPAISLLHIHDIWASDLAPRFADAQTYLHRGSLLVVAAGLLVWTAALYKRADGASRSRRGLYGALLVVLGIGGIATVALRCIQSVELRAMWLTAHERAVNTNTAVIRHITGVVDIDPGRELALDLELQLAVPPDSELRTLAFTFNPGLEIAELRVDDDAAPFSHRLGLLNVELPEPLAARSMATLRLQAAGLPDADFAYLDSTLDWRLKSSRNQILRLGTAAGLFEARYVALMPALRWLPVPGPNRAGVARGNLPTIDLSVGVPDGWLVAGPGRRRAGDGGRFRFRPGAPVPEVAIIAGRFERRAIQVGDIELELLMQPEHLANLAPLADLQERLEARVAELIGLADELGIPYPYDGFALVEVPAHLREYGGGWALDSVMELPGLLLLKENGLAFANFSFADPAFAGNPESLAQLRWSVLSLWFQAPYFSANAVKNLARHLTTYQSHAIGPGASALDDVVEELARPLLDEFPAPRPATFNVHEWDVRDDIGARLTPMVRFLTPSRRGGSPGFSAVMVVPGLPATWDAMLGASLAELDMEQESLAALEARWLRVHAAARSIRESLGRTRTAAFLASLRNRGVDGAFDANDFDAAAAQAGLDLATLLGDWINDAALPGFQTSRAQVAEITDSDGRLRYETRVHVRNDEPVPGLVRLSTGGFGPSTTEPFQIPGDTTMEIGLVTDARPDSLWLEPYLALNRGMVWIDLGTDQENPPVRAPLTGTRPSAWVPPVEGIVIDDLDPGFAVEHRNGQRRVGEGSPTSGGHERYLLDQGLPGNSSTPGEWSRVPYPTSWGKYRHTVAGALAGDGNQVAVFAADLPASGRWRLDFHKPDPQPAGFGSGRSYATLGSFDMKLVADGETTPVPFDGEVAEVGWNKIDEFEFTTTAVRLEVSSKTDGAMVIADAIRWVPLD